MRLLLDHGAPLHPSSGSAAPLTVAVTGRQKAAVELLLQRGAKPDFAAAQNGITALHWAAALGYPEIVHLLLIHGATVDAPSSWLGTPLFGATRGRAAWSDGWP